MIYDDRDQNSGYLLLEILTEKGLEGAFWGARNVENLIWLTVTRIYTNIKIHPDTLNIYVHFILIKK